MWYSILFGLKMLVMFKAWMNYNLTYDKYKLQAEG